MLEPIAIVGLACRYPDAQSPEELWENALAGRRAFRRIPAERLPLRDYGSVSRDDPDRTYATKAALIEGYEFDRVRFRVAGSSYRSTDLTHWLALDVADLALRDAGFEEGRGLPRDSTGVVLGNTLTGEFSRANAMRLRWPYVQRVVDEGLREEGFSESRRGDFLRELEGRFKAPFPALGEDSLSGSLANTIAGRICNHFDLKGGGYTVDGACASSLISVATACSSLAAGDLDVALAGGVDLSLDPFELVGFARLGALAADAMRIFDARPSGFWPGEGCGLAVLMRAADAHREGHRIYAVIRGWGMSSDGSGDLTRPEVEGQLLALRRAYLRAGIGPDSVGYFEGHGTGTATGDATELEVLIRARREAEGAGPTSNAAVGSIKANIGHTKAAAGVAGLIKAALCLRHGVLPPTIACETPHPLLSDDSDGRSSLRVLDRGEPWPSDQPRRAGVSAMGFGGINTHVVMEAATEAGAETRPAPPGGRLSSLLSSPQDSELFLLAAADATDLERQVGQLGRHAGRLSLAELGDLAATLARSLPSRDEAPPAYRAALTASTPEQLAGGLERLAGWLASHVEKRLDLRQGVFLGSGTHAPRIGFLFPGQASPVRASAGAMGRRFERVRALYAEVQLPEIRSASSTALAQPAIAAATLAGLRLLESFGIEAELGLGHSLGEICALHWAGALEADALLRVATIRGRVMAELGDSGGAMASIASDAPTVEKLLHDTDVVIAGFNSPRQSVVSGPAPAVRRILARAADMGLRGTLLPVSRAFHSPLVAACAEALRTQLADQEFAPLRRRVLSSVREAPLDSSQDLLELLLQQILSPVRFRGPLERASHELDLWIEVGPGSVLVRLAQETTKLPAISIDAGGGKLLGLWRALGAAHALGAPLRVEALLEDRFTRPFDLDWQPRFFVNPCERTAGDTRDDRSQLPPASIPPASDSARETAAAREGEGEGATIQPESTLELVRELVVARCELPPASVADDDRLLSDLHLSSIAAAQLVAEAARRCNLPPPLSLTDYADATLNEVAEALDELERSGGGSAAAEQARRVSGVDRWVRDFRVRWVEKPLPRHRRPDGEGRWQLFAPAGDALGPALLEALEADPGEGGIAVHLPPRLDSEHCVHLLLAAAQQALMARGPRTFLLLQHQVVGGALARTLHREARGLTTCVLELPAEVSPEQTLDWTLLEVRSAIGYREARYDSQGQRFERRLELLPSCEPAAAMPLSSADHLLVTGGGKGIAAECALDLATQTGVRLALVGRARPERDQELARNLERFEASGIAFVYLPADVCDADAVAEAVKRAQQRFGPVTALLHAAGRNQPRLLLSLTEEDFQHTLAPKLRGAENLLAAIDPARLRLFITFGSLISQLGMQGEADYAMANEWLTRLTEDFQAAHPDCRCCALQWSIWSGAGMGERLGRIDALEAQGITAIGPEEGTAALRRVIAAPETPVAVVISGRFGDAPTLAMDAPELPFLRFLEQTPVHCPEIEMVAEAELSLANDPYLDDHVFSGDRILPGVMGLEAMAQVAGALAGSRERPVFESVSFERPVVVAEQGTTRIRIAALTRATGRIEVALRCETSGFAADHFRAVCHFAASTPVANPPTAERQGVGHTSRDPLSLDPRRQLYDRLLFQAGRFRRVAAYTAIAARACRAELTPDPGLPWFGRYLPADLVLGDPGARDAAIHAIQVCVPDATLLPVGVDRIEFAAPAPPMRAAEAAALESASTPLQVRAVERDRAGDVFTYDLELTDANGRRLELWSGLRLQLVAGSRRTRLPALELLTPLLERRAESCLEADGLHLAIVKGADAAASQRAVDRALGRSVELLRRPDGRPEIAPSEERREEMRVSSSHAAGWTLAACAPGPVACDIELVQEHPESTWRDLLGSRGLALAKLVARDRREDLSISATRVWSTLEAFKKAGVRDPAPVLEPSQGGEELASCAVLSTGGLRVLTLATELDPEALQSGAPGGPPLRLVAALLVAAGAAAAAGGASGGGDARV